jgi:hypothetical protein
MEDKFHEFGMMSIVAQPVRGKPIQAAYEEIHVQKFTGRRERVSAALCRDSSGRTRIDWFLDAMGPPATLSGIYDPEGPVQ